VPVASWPLKTFLDELALPALGLPEAWAKSRWRREAGLGRFAALSRFNTPMPHSSRRPALGAGSPSWLSVRQGDGQLISRSSIWALLEGAAAGGGGLSRR